MQKASSWARTQLTHEYPEEYLEYYYRLKDEFQLRLNCRGLATSKAKTLLVQNHVVEYRKLRERAIQQGFPRSRTTGG